MTYREEFTPGTRVVVRAGPGEGTDHEANGRQGTMVAVGRALAVNLDKPPRYWSNPAFICMHNLQRVNQ